MVFLMLGIWVLLAVAAGGGVYRLAVRLVPAAVVDVILLPGTVVSEVAAMLGCLLTGGSVSKARLISSIPGRRGPELETRPGLKWLGPVVASAVAILTGGVAIVVAYRLLDEPVITKFYLPSELNDLSLAMLPQGLPRDIDAVWEALALQGRLVVRMIRTWGRIDWSDWQVALFMYLGVCFAVRLGPVRRPLWPTLTAVGLLAGLLALAGLFTPASADAVDRIWPLLTYVYTTLLVLLGQLAAAWLLVQGAKALIPQGRAAAAEA